MNMVKYWKIKKTGFEIWFSNVPRKEPGMSIQRKYYAHHIITITFYMFGYKLSIVRMEN